ncbi:MAG: GNAT family N-acetyltransferase [Leptolyngbyaceae cyanobacterium RU_5_1]|nr:GNAT family N-acetyltransferase [Leptolyngbyaceae cyanobacterium RU_5_1]
MTLFLHTELLSLRPCQLSNLDALYQLWTQGDIKRFLFDDRPITLDEARSWIASSTICFTRHGYGIWLFFEHQSDQIAGFSGLLWASQKPPNLVFGTRPQLWGRGHVREATSAVLRYGLDVLDLEKVVADVDAPNNASIQVLEALGMSRTGGAIVNQHPLFYYETQSRINR